VFQVSAKTGEGMDAFAARISGKLSAFVGQSGVGKSSLLNVLDQKLTLRIGDLSEKYGRGTHTTTKGMLFHLPPFDFDAPDALPTSVVDTPGVRRFVLHDIPAKDLALYFREMEPLVGSCTWGMSCSHQHEPGCKILEAVYAGVIHEQRYESWQRIREEIETGSWSD
jgi:ribosome biogenesis GTPase